MIAAGGILNVKAGTDEDRRGGVCVSTLGLAHSIALQSSSVPAFTFRIRFFTGPTVRTLPR